ncbi:MAG: OmpH family outer membrane protein [Gammaproteobacteria bacterium]|nr:OmpH family outer membrane protein [Gammaproteobacteria bacterium]MDD9807523.1 OmpH family outer membrane protein [Gammaproteobacteria bacterium]MDD9869642.1 OmpH family outer membrane protein [Gammaproteobacteria bacterium]MDD9885740.1 OmpH family outer membrane protein [Gammaproteobacteria bacterium]
MTTTLRIFLAAGCIATAAWQAAAAQADNIAFINVARVMQEAPQAAAARERLQEEFSGRNDKLLESQEQIEKLENRLRDSGAGMEAAKRRRLEREIASRKRRLRTRTEDFQSEFSDRRNEELADIQKMVSKVISDVAKKRKFDLVVSEPVLYASDRIDMTDTIIEMLEKRAR